MKILLDPILTARPEQCSTTYQFYSFVHDVLFVQKRTDLFFYWMVPDYVPKEDLSFYPKHPNVQLVFVPQSKDRTVEYLSLAQEVDDVVAFNGSYWDWDVMLTVRSGLAQLYRLLATSPRQKNEARSKKIWVIEEMPLMSFKKTVAQFDRDTQNLYTANGYLAADQVFVTLCHERAGILEVAKEYLAPSQYRKLPPKIREFVPSANLNPGLKTEEAMFSRQKARPFGLFYVGRMDTTSSRLDDIDAIMRASKVKYKDDVYPFVCTVSQTHKTFNPEYVHIRNLKRDQFWTAMREQADLGIMLHRDAGYSLSLAEPLTMGVPFAVAPEPWAKRMLGPDYPFYYSSRSEILGLVDAFHSGYASLYKRFAEWHEKYWIPVCKQRAIQNNLNQMLSESLDSLTLEEDYLDKHAHPEDSLLVQEVIQLVKYKQEFILFDELKNLSSLNIVSQLMAQKTEPGDRQRRGLVWATAWNDLRMALKSTLNLEDASIMVGHMRRKNPVQ